MAGEDNLSSRFDYLFEPLEDDTSADGSIDADSPAADPDGETPTYSAANRWPHGGGGGTDDGGLLPGPDLPGPL